MCDLDVARWQRIRVHTKTVILRGDFHLFGQQILNGMIRSVMPESQLESFSAKREPAQLVAQADSEDRHLSQQVAYRFDRVGGGLRIARAVGKKYSVGLQCERVLSRSFCGHYNDIAVVIH